MKKAYKFTYILAIMTLAIVIIFTFIIGSGAQNARAATIFDVLQSNQVMKDLQKDENFDASKYPANSKDYSVDVIQIAESKGGKLYLYAYQPCMSSTRFYATKINMSLTDKMGGIINDDTVLTDDDKPKLFDLQLIGYSGVFCKYLILDYDVDYSNSLRHYNIVSIFRKFIKGVDDDVESGSTNNINEVSFKVAQLWSVKQDGDDVYYDLIENQTIEITDKLVGSIAKTKFDLPWWLNTVSYNTDWISWYIAFDTDLPIDKIISADLSFTYMTLFIDVLTPQVKVVAAGKKSPTLKYDDKRVLEGYNKYFDHYSYEFKRIQSVDDFLKTEKLDDKDKAKFEGKKWILRFHETIYEDLGLFDVPLMALKSYVSNVSVLRLEFMMDGEHYNLGVVDNIQSPDPSERPSRVVEEKLSFLQYVWRCIERLFNGTANPVEIVVAVIALLLVFLILPLILIVLSAIFPAFGQVLLQVIKFIGIGIKYFFIGLWWVICLPVKGIKALINLIKNRNTKMASQNSKHVKKRSTTANKRK